MAAKNGKAKARPKVLTLLVKLPARLVDRIDQARLDYQREDESRYKPGRDYVIATALRQYLTPVEIVEDVVLED